MILPLSLISCAFSPSTRDNSAGSCLLPVIDFLLLLQYLLYFRGLHQNRAFVYILKRFIVVLVLFHLTWSDSNQCNETLKVSSRSKFLFASKCDYNCDPIDHKFILIGNKIPWESFLVEVRLKTTLIGYLLKAFQWGGGVGLTTFCDLFCRLIGLTQLLMAM